MSYNGLYTLGDRVIVAIDASGIELKLNQPIVNTMEMDIIGVKISNKLPMVGIKTLFDNFWEFRYEFIQDFDMVANYQDYKYAWNCHMSDILILGKANNTVQTIVKVTGGLHCDKCNDYYPYAESNQTNGTLICFACQNGLASIFV